MSKSSKNENVIALFYNNIKIGDNVETTLNNISENKANIKLIAAAPQLLQACIYILQSYECKGLEILNETEAEFYKLCKEAVNKALV